MGKPRVAPEYIYRNMVTCLRLCDYERGRKMSEYLRKELGIDSDKPIPADYEIPYFVHQDDFNRLDQSHKRIEKWILGFAIALFVALVGTNVAWIIYENQFEDVVTETYTAETDQGGTAIANGDGTVTVNGESDLHKNN